MGYNIELMKRRLRETFGSDSQDTVGKKLNMTQGNVSKLLSGTQQPTLETINSVAEVYDVSTDWLLGLTEKKSIDKNAAGTSYAQATKVLSNLILAGAIKQIGDDDSLQLVVQDPLVNYLTKKNVTLRKTDVELTENWIENKLTLFEECSILSTSVWEECDIDFLSREAVTETNWKEVYEKARKKEEELAELFGSDAGPFEG